MVHAYHVIFCTYGFWLPNDPRGSWSEFVGSWELLKFGGATKTNTRRSVAHVRHDANARNAAKQALKRPPVSLTGPQARAVGRGFAEYAGRSQVVVWACSILPEHVHLVVARHRLDIEPLVNQLKGYATRQLLAERLNPLADATDGHSCWARGLWKAFLNNPFEIERAVRYVELNPVKEGLPAQRWRVVQPYPHAGPPPRSPTGRG